VFHEIFFKALISAVSTLPGCCRGRGRFVSSRWPCCHPVTLASSHDPCIAHARPQDLKDLYQLMKGQSALPGRLCAVRALAPAPTRVQAGRACEVRMAGCSWEVYGGRGARNDSSSVHSAALPLNRCPPLFLRMVLAAGPAPEPPHRAADRQTWAGAVPIVHSLLHQRCHLFELS
jgi:hypothetical protein